MATRFVVGLPYNHLRVLDNRVQRFFKDGGNRLLLNMLSLFLGNIWLEFCYINTKGGADYGHRLCYVEVRLC